MTKSKRERKKEFYNQPCYFCKRLMVKPGSIESEENPGLTCSTEHYFPKTRGGTNDPDNIKYSCQRCNGLKGSVIPEIFEPFAFIVIRKHPNAPNPILKDAFKQYIMSLAEIAVRNRVATKKALLITLLHVDETIKGR